MMISSKRIDIRHVYPVLRGHRAQVLRQGLQLPHQGFKRSFTSTFRTLAPAATPIEKVYERKTPIEHVLLRPGVYSPG